MPVQTFKTIENYPGSKAAAGQWQKILSEIPKCSIFVEAMCGSAFISSLVADTGCIIVINDCDKTVLDKIKLTATNTLQITKLNLDYQKVINKFDPIPGTVFFFDPPYKMETRSYQGKLYRFDWKDNDHKRFLKALQRVKSPCIVTHYPCKEYDQALKKWRQITYNSMTRAGVREERLYMNFPPPALLQCFRYVGQNFTDRQRISRKVKRLINRFYNQKQKERAAILSAIIHHFDYVKS